jgi:hypothetical protein
LLHQQFVKLVSQVSLSLYVVGNKVLIKISDCSFSLFAQRKRTSSEAAKERAAHHLAYGFPVLLEKIGRCETHRLWRFRQSSR